MNKFLVIATLAMMALTAFAGTKGIYGPDNRKDLYQVKNPLHLKLAQSTAGMIHLGMLSKVSETTFDLRQIITLERAENLCTSEKFAQQPLAPQCSGFLVGPDTLVTAGHCYNTSDTPEINCKNYAWVFDYDLKTAKADPTKNITSNNIYLCKSVLSVQRDHNYDFAVIKLDRKVVGREPLKFRSSGKIADKTSLMVIGHPNGLPTKVAAGGKITLNTAATYFSSNLDTFHGNSGSAVFDAVTGQVEGILVMGKNDYVPSIQSIPDSCKVVNKCDDNANNCSSGMEYGVVMKGEVVLRIDTIASKISKALALP